MAPEVCEFGKTSEGSCQNLKSSVKCCVRVEGVGEQVVRTKSATCVSLVNVGVIFNVNGNDITIMKNLISCVCRMMKITAKQEEGLCFMTDYISLLNNIFFSTCMRKINF